MSVTKPFDIPKERVMKAFKLVKANAGVSGVDQQTIADFEKDLKNNLYKLWNRLSSGSYFPPPVRAVPIPKKTGGERILGVPTVSDRIAQMIVRLEFEPCVEPCFLDDSYGYRPNKSALDAVGITRQRCFENKFVLEYDIKGFFDNLNHELLLKAVNKHTENKWVILYIKRWLKAPMQLTDGSLVERNKGVPQGGVISPVLSNLFLHYVFDSWMKRNYPNIPWCRYADDGLLHCKTEEQAKYMLVELKKRFEECALELHPDKTKIVYCDSRDKNRKEKYRHNSFVFLGYEFQAREARKKQSNDKRIFLSFQPAVSKSAQNAMRAKIRDYKLHRRTDVSIEDIAQKFNPILRGWIKYYGRYYAESMDKVLYYFDRKLEAWLMRKFIKLKRRNKQARIVLEKIREQKPRLFVHWKGWNNKNGCLMGAV